MPGFAAGRDACGRAWGQKAPASPDESQWRVGPGFGWGLGLWLVLLPVAHGVPSYAGLAGNLPGVRPRPVPGFAAGRDACSRAWGQNAPARPGESRCRVGPGFGWGLGLWLVLLPVAHGVPSSVGLAGKLEGLGPGRYRVSQQAGTPAVGLGGRDAPASPGESRWRVGPGFGWGLG